MSEQPTKLSQRQLTVLADLRAAIKTAPTPERRCGDCSRCCEGWLSGSAYGHAFAPGCPCFFLEKTCTIYADRPVDPCRTYQCAWLAEATFPMWMKPVLSNLLITFREDPRSGLFCYFVDQVGSSVDPRALAWLERWADGAHVNVELRLQGEPLRRVGAPAFVTASDAGRRE